MKDFLSNIGFGVVDLDDFLKEGPSALMPTFLFNPTKQAESKIKKLEKEQIKVLNLHSKVNDKQKVVLEEIYDNLDSKLKEQRKEKTRSKIEKELRSSGGIFDRFQNLYQSGAGKVALGAGGMAIRSIQKTFSNISSMVDETGMTSSKLLKDFDAIGKSSREIVMNGERLYNSVDKNFDTFIGLRREFGATEDISVKLLDNISQMENIIGLTNEDAISLLSTFRGINRETAETNYKLIRGASQLADANNVAFRDVMQDITDNSEFFATYMSQSSDKISEIIVKSRRLGLSFSTFNKIFENLSGIEGAIEQQARLSIFSGQRMNLLDVMEKKYRGDTQGAMSSIMNQIGGISQSQFDNPFVKKQLAGGLGVGVEELNKIYREATGTQSIDDKLESSLDEFNENFKQLGFGTIKESFVRYIMNPITNLMKNNTQQIQSVFNAISGIIKKIGGFTTAVLTAWTSSTAWIKKNFGQNASMIAQVAGAVGAMKAVSFGVSKISEFFSPQVMLLKQIAMNTAITAGKSTSGGAIRGLYNYGSGTKQAGYTRTGNAMMGTAIGTRKAIPKMIKGAGILGILGAGAGAFMGGKADDEFSKAGLLTSIGSGALGGSILGPWGALGGAVVGGGGYLLGNSLNDSPSRTVKGNRGGIFKKRYTGQMDVAEAGKPEGFVPLETKDGKPTMPVDLSDDAIKKLASAISKMKFSGNVTVDGKKNKTMEFYNEVMQATSPLNV